MGREQEFTEYVGTRWPRLVRTAVLLGCPSAEAEGVVRAALVRCLTDWAQVRRADDREVYVHRVLVEHLRAAARRCPTPDPATDAVRGDTDPVLGRLLRIPLDQRLAVVLCDYAGLDELQTAAATGLSYGRVGTCLVTARAALVATAPVSSLRDVS
ncbi:MAG: SigE family RNA polymerase sigma factor [Nocardioides sp.]